MNIMVNPFGHVGPEFIMAYEEQRHDMSLITVISDGVVLKYPSLIIERPRDPAFSPGYWTL